MAVRDKIEKMRVRNTEVRHRIEKMRVGDRINSDHHPVEVVIRERKEMEIRKKGEEGMEGGTMKV